MRRNTLPGMAVCLVGLADVADLLPVGAGLFGAGMQSTTPQHSRLQPSNCEKFEVEGELHQHPFCTQRA